MVFTNAGKNKVRDLVDTELLYGEFGSGTTTPAFTDTALVSSLTGGSFVVTTQLADKQIIVDTNLPATALQGSTAAEFGVFTDDTMLARVTFASLVHESTEQWQFSTRLFVD